MSAKQAAEICTPEEVPEDVHFELLFDDEIDWDEWGGECEPVRHVCINSFWPLSWFFNIGIIATVSVGSMNKFDLYMIWFCGWNMKYMSSFQPKRSVKRILATFPRSLQCRMSTNRPWPSSRAAHLAAAHGVHGAIDSSTCCGCRVYVEPCVKLHPRWPISWNSSNNTCWRRACAPWICEL